LFARFSSFSLIRQESLIVSYQTDEGSFFHLRFHPDAPCAVTTDFDRVRFFFSIQSINLYSRLQATEMNNELQRCAAFGYLERVKQLVEDGADIEETDNRGRTALSVASLNGHFKIVVYLVEHGANVAHTDDVGMTALHRACVDGNISTVKYLLEHGATVIERDAFCMTTLLHAAGFGHLGVVQYLLSFEGGASSAEADNEGRTALLLAAGSDCYPSMVQWLLEYGGAQITDTNLEGGTVWTELGQDDLADMLKCAYTKSGDRENAYLFDEDDEYLIEDGEYVPHGDIVALVAMLRVMVLHGGPPESLTAKLALPLQRIVQYGARLRARLPTYLAQRQILLDAHCPLLPPLQDLVRGYEELTTTDELWATGLGAALQRAKRSRPERGQSPERRSARLRQKRQ
jgi:hypothetical protein